LSPHRFRLLRRLFDRAPLWIGPGMMSWAVLCFFALMLASILLAPDPWPWRSAAFPLAIAAICGLLSLAETAVARIPFLRSRCAPRGVLDLGLETDLPAHRVRAKANAALAWFAALIGGIAVAGFHVAVPVFTAAYLRLVTRANWLATGLYAGGIWLVLFVLFDRMMQVRWPAPLIAP
jgi:hypothetical protein